MRRATYHEPMPEQGQRGSAPLDDRRPSRSRCALAPLCALIVAISLVGCAGDDPAADDAGLLVPVAKDAHATGDPDAGTSGDDAAIADADAVDATAPDAGPPPPDRDQDGIPDAVDPAPDAPNRVLFRDDFDALNPMWLFTSSAMAPRGGLLTLTQTDAIVREGWLGPQPNWTDTLVRTSMRVLRRGRSEDDGAGRVAILIRIQQVAPDRYLACGIDARRNLAFFAEHNGGNTAGRTLEDAPLPTAVGAWHDVSVSTQATRVVCRVDGIELEVSNALYLSGSAGLRAFDAAFEADFLAVHAL